MSVHPFLRTPIQALDAYDALSRQAQADPRLMHDLAFLDRMVEAKERYFRLVAR